MIVALTGLGSYGGREDRTGRGDLAGAAHLELVFGVVQLRPEDDGFEAMLRGLGRSWPPRGLREGTITTRELLVKRFMAFTNDYQWSWTAGQLDEWSLSLTAEWHFATSPIRHYQGKLRLFSDCLTDPAGGGNRIRLKGAASSFRRSGGSPYELDQ